MDFSQLFHQSTKDRSHGGTVRIPHSIAQWPESWKTVVYKTYPRLPSIALPNAAPLPVSLTDAIAARKSARDFDHRPVSAEALSTLLKLSAGIQSSGSRAQPSGGGRYPLEIYPVVFAGTPAVPAGVYHYDVSGHALDTLWQRAFTPDDIGRYFTYGWAREASMALFITAIFARNQMKYGERGYRQILIEAGAIVQNVYLVSSALGLKACAIDGVHEPMIETLLDIDGYSESVVVSAVVG